MVNMYHILGRSKRKQRMNSSLRKKRQSIERRATIRKKKEGGNTVEDDKSCNEKLTSNDDQSITHTNSDEHCDHRRNDEKFDTLRRKQFNSDEETRLSFERNDNDIRKVSKTSSLMLSSDTVDMHSLFRQRDRNDDSSAFFGRRRLNVQEQNKDANGNRSKSLTQIDCLDSSSTATAAASSSSSSSSAKMGHRDNMEKDHLREKTGLNVNSRNRNNSKFFLLCEKVEISSSLFIFSIIYSLYLGEDNSSEETLSYNSGNDTRLSNSLTTVVTVAETAITIPGATSSTKPLSISPTSASTSSAAAVSLSTTPSLSQTKVASRNSFGSSYKDERLPSSSSTSSSTKTRKTYGSQRGRRGAITVSEEDCQDDNSFSSSLSSTSTLTLHESSLRSLTSKSRQQSGHSRKSGGIFSNPFKTDKEKMDQLSEYLNLYSINGIPKQSSLLTFDHHNEQKFEEIYFIEDNWQTIVFNSTTLPKRLQNQQDAIWELLHTEVAYIRMLKVISELFLSCLCNLQSECLLNDIDTEKMFSNITEVYSANHQFWVEYLLPVLAKSRQTNCPLNPIIMTEGFLKFEQIFHPYIKYCLEHSKCSQHVKEKYDENELFKTYVVWCETRKDCDRLRLRDMLVKPMQRLTKYPLLLKAILKKSEIDEEKEALKQMNHSVEKFVFRVNGALRRRHDEERLYSVASRIESYDVLETSNDEVEKAIREYCHLDLTCPLIACQSNHIRQLLYEGSGLKLKDTYTSSKVDVHCFLFTDILLICKCVGKKSGDRVKVIRQPYLLEKMVTQELKDNSGFIVIYLNEFNVATNAFILYTPESKIWIDNVRKAQIKYKELKRSSLLSIQASFRTFDEDEDFDIPTTALLHAASNSLRSSRSSLLQSNSVSTEVVDVSTSSSAHMVPSNTPCHLSQLNLLQQQQPARAVSFELGDLRNPSMTVEDTDVFGRSHSMETRTPLNVTITSPRPERRAFLLKGSGLSPGTSSNTLSVNAPSCPLTAASKHHQHYSSDPPSIPVPTMQHVASKFLQRSIPISTKPPLIKTKNLHKTQSLTNRARSAPSSEGPSPVHSFESEVDTEYASCSIDDQLKSKLNQKRNNRAERRYHTADSIESMKKDKDASIHKRLSWNLGANHGQSNRLLCNKHLIKCLSSDSVYTSSGFSSTESVTLSVSSDQCPETYKHFRRDIPGVITTKSAVETEAETAKRKEEVESKIKIDVSEVKDGISSVQITVHGGNGNKPSKSDLKKMKELLLTSLEASEV